MINRSDWQTDSADRALVQSRSPRGADWNRGTRRQSAVNHFLLLAMSERWERGGRATMRWARCGGENEAATPLQM